jgi:hypothetical protein
MSFGSAITARVGFSTCVRVLVEYGGQGQRGKRLAGDWQVQDERQYRPRSKLVAHRDGKTDRCLIKTAIVF